MEDDGIVYARSAFKHGYTEEDVRWAAAHYRAEGPLDDREDVSCIVGPDYNGNLIEILYNRIDIDIIKVFHVDKLTQEVADQFGL